MCIRDRVAAAKEMLPKPIRISTIDSFQGQEKENIILSLVPVSYTHLRAHETVLDLVCSLLLETKKYKSYRHHRDTNKTPYDSNRRLSSYKDNGTTVCMMSHL